jgi:hypothetical protein
MSSSDLIKSGEMTQETIAAVMKYIANKIGDLLKDFEYTPKDAPYVRRKAMIKLKITHNDVMSFWVMMLLRGGNKKRLLAGASEEQINEIRALVMKFKIKNTAIVNREGLFSTWQVMSSFFDYGVMLINQSDELKRKLCIFVSPMGDVYKIEMGISLFMVVPGAFHLMQGMDPVLIDNYIRHVILYQNLVIYVKGTLAGKSADVIRNLMSQERNRTNRKTQYSFNRLAATPSKVNFDGGAVAGLQKTLNFDGKLKTDLKDWDFENQPLPDAEIKKFIQISKI